MIKLNQPVFFFHAMKLSQFLTMSKIVSGEDRNRGIAQIVSRNTEQKSFRFINLLI